MPNRLVIEDLADTRVRVLLRRAGQEFDEPSGEPVPFTSPFGEAEREDLRWYLEDYLTAPYAVYEDRGQAVQAKLADWGKTLFAAVFGPGKPGASAYAVAREGACTLVLRSTSPAFLGLPWELLRDPNRATPLALDLQSIDRTLKAAGGAADLPPGPELRVLMVIARPAGLEDVGYQMIARPLLRRLAAVRGQVTLEVLRPPTLEALKSRLDAASAAGRPYHILHFDGHGTFGRATATPGGNRHQYDAATKESGFLVFEAEGGGDDLVPADDFAQVVNQARVPLVVLNACRSAMLGEAVMEATVATRLLEGGAASVVAMGYSVYAVAAAEFMAAFYEALFDRKTVSEAVAEGRRRLSRRRKRPSPKGPLPLEDWMVPVHYLRRSVSFSTLQPPAAQAGAPALDRLLDEMRGAGVEAAASGDPLAPVGEFVGRDNEFYALELALQWQHVAVVHGPAGMGKTELAKAFGRWWQATGGVEQPGLVFFYSFEPGLPSFGLDGVISHVGLKLFGPEFVSRTRDAPEREALVLGELRKRRLLLIWDNFETVREMPDPSGATPPLTEAEQERVRRFLATVARDGKTSVLITSRTPEAWLGNVRRLELGGLARNDAIEMAEDVLKSLPAARLKRGSKDFEDLMAWIGGHPLSLRLLLPQLENVSAAQLLAAVKGETASLPPGFAGEGRTESLGASLQYSFAHLTAAQRGLCCALALFEGVVYEDVLAVFSAAGGVPTRFAGTDKATWSALLARLVTLGVVSGPGGGMYRLHPALPAYLSAAWRQTAGTSFAAERDAADLALLKAYAAFGDWLTQQIDTGAAEFAFAAIDLQRRTMGRLLGGALTRGQSQPAQAIMQPLNEFWNARGLAQEARGWVDRCRTALEDGQGNPPDLDGEDGGLWLFAVGSEANRSLGRHDFDAAVKTYETIRRKLEAAPPAQKGQQRLAVIYHQLGRVAQDSGDPAAAEAWYRKSLEISEALGNRPDMAGSYHHLGMVAQLGSDLAAAEAWYRKSLEISESVGNRPGMANSYHQLGMVAQLRVDLVAAEAWYRKSLEIKEALGNRPSMASSYHQLGAVAQDRGDLAPAEAWYRKSLEIREALGNRPGMVDSYHQLGVVAQLRGELAAAEAWYRKSLEISEALGHRPVMASSYHQLGTVAQDRGDLAAAEAWYRKSLEINEALGNRPVMALTYAQMALLTEARGQPRDAMAWAIRCVTLFPEFPHPATGSGPRHLARLTASLGWPALQESWLRTTGTALPDQVRATIAAMIEAGKQAPPA